MSRNPPLGALDIPTLRVALEKSESARVAIEEISDELGMVHIVLSKEIAGAVALGSDGNSALARTAVLEQKLVEVAARLADLSEALKQLAQAQ